MQIPHANYIVIVSFYYLCFFISLSLRNFCASKRTPNRAKIVTGPVNPGIVGVCSGVAAAFASAVLVPVAFAALDVFSSFIGFFLAQAKLVTLQSHFLQAEHI